MRHHRDQDKLTRGRVCPSERTDIICDNYQSVFAIVSRRRRTLSEAQQSEEAYRRPERGLRRMKEDRPSVGELAESHLAPEMSLVRRIKSKSSNKTEEKSW